MEKIIIQSFLKKSSHWGEEKIKKAYDNLKPYIEEYSYLSEITDWQTISDIPEIYIKLQEAYDIMLGYEVRNHFMRCRPCERMALCAIKDITENSVFPNMKFQSEKEAWEVDEMVSKLLISDSIKKECNIKHEKFLQTRSEYYKSRINKQV